MGVRYMPSVVFVMELNSIEYIRVCRRRLLALTVARVVVKERTDIIKYIWKCDMPRWLL